jgi:MFS family permease
MEEFKQRFGTCNNKTENDDICAKDSALIVAILSVGTAVGALLAAPAGDSLGRRRTLLLSVFIFCVGAILQVSAERLNALLVGRWVSQVSISFTNPHGHPLCHLISARIYSWLVPSSSPPMYTRGHGLTS